MNENANRFVGIPLWLILLGSVLALAPLSIDMYLPALPTISHSLGATAGQIQATLASYFIGLASAQIVYGPLSDRFGRKPPLLVGLVIYSLASLLCALSSGAVMLIASRFLQAVGGAAGMVIARAIVRDRCNTTETAKAFSVLMLVIGVAPILAPMLGGVLLAVSGWRAIFVVLAGYGLLMTAAVYFGVEESNPQKRSDALKGSVIISTYKSLFRQRDFLGYTLSNGLVWCGMFAYISASSFVFIKHYQFSEAQYALLFGFNAMGLIGFSQINGWLLKRYRISFILERAMYVPLLAMALLLLGATVLSATPWVLIAGLFVYISSLGLISPNGAALAMHNQMKVAGSASALLGALQFALAAVASGISSFFAGPSALPMSLIMCACAMLGFAVFRKTHESLDDRDQHD